MSFGSAAVVDRLTCFELKNLLEIAARCVSVSAVPSLVDVISSLSAVVPFERAAAGVAVTGCGPPQLERWVNHSFGKSWEEAYLRERFSAVDPVLRYAQQVDDAFRWSNASGIFTLSDSPDFYECACDHGLVDGVTFSSRAGGSDRCTVLTLAGIPEGDAARALRVLSLVGPHIHEGYRRLVSDGTEQAREPLSEREKDVLNWTQQGKTYWEIGCILGISERTVKFHFQRIKEKLDAVSPPHAVARALRLGIIR